VELRTFGVIAGNVRIRDLGGHRFSQKKASDKKKRKN
jgi:hypothetical protein